MPCCVLLWINFKCIFGVNPIYDISHQCETNAHRHTCTHYGHGCRCCHCPCHYTVAATATTTTIHICRVFQWKMRQIMEAAVQSNGEAKNGHKNNQFEIWKLSIYLKKTTNCRATLIEYSVLCHHQLNPFFYAVKALHVAFFLFSQLYVCWFFSLISSSWFANKIKCGCWYWLAGWLAGLRGAHCDIEMLECVKLLRLSRCHLT